LKKSFVVLERPGSLLLFVDWQPAIAPKTKLATKIIKIKQISFFMVYVPIYILINNPTNNPFNRYDRQPPAR